MRYLVVIFNGAVILAALLIGCDLDLPFDPPKTAPKGAKALSVEQTDIALLRKYVNVPFTPLRVVWQTMPRNNDDWWLAALIEYSPSDRAMLLEKLQQMPGQILVLPQHLGWFPASVRARYESIAPDANGMLAIAGQRHDAKLFVASDKSPLVVGYTGIFDNSGLLYLALSTF